MASPMDIFDTETDQDETFCEEAETGIDEKLEEIENSIRSHTLRKVFMTKPQMQEYKEFLTNVSPHLDKTKRCLASTFLTQLEKIERTVAEFERKWLSQHSSTSTFHCSLLTNQDFVSEEQPKICSQATKETAAEENNSQHVETRDETAMAVATDAATQFVQPTADQARAETDEKKIFEAKLDKTLELIKQFKINLLKDLVASRSHPLPSFNSTVTSLVPDEYKISPTTEARNQEAVFKIQMEAKKWDMFNDKSKSNQK